MTDGLPEVVCARPHHEVYRRDVDAVQFGLLPGGAFEVAGLSGPLRQWLLELHGSWPTERLLTRAVELGADRERARSVLVELHASGVLIDARRPARVAEARRAGRVALFGAGPLRDLVAVGLSKAGVGTVRAYVHGEVPRSGARPDLIVLTDLVNPSTEPHQVWLAGGVPVLPARLVDGAGLVGPLVLPGRSACLRCLELHRADHDECWGTVSADLSGRIGSADPACALGTAALTTAQALRVTDAMVDMAATSAPPVLDAMLEFRLELGELRRHPCPPHPGCDCAAGRNAA